MIRHLSTRGIPRAALPLLLASTVAGQAAPSPQPYAIQNVSVGRASSEDGGRTLLLRDGRIEAILGADAELPRGVRIVDGTGLLCLPGFVDTNTTTGVETPEPVKDQDVPVDVGADVRVDMRQANRKGIQPSFEVAGALSVEPDSIEAWQAAGFGTALIAPSGQLLSGASCAAATREAAMRDLVMLPDTFVHAAFRASGPSYPSTLMGYHAQLRQFFLDADHHRTLKSRFDEGRPGARPPFDAELEAGIAILEGEVPLVCQADSSRDIERWIRLADEFGLSVRISGGREAWRVADRLAERRIPVFLTLDWGDEVDDPSPDDEKDEKAEASAEESTDEESAEAEPAEEDEADAAEGEAEDEEADEPNWIYDEPLVIREERRRLWEEDRDNAIRLHEAGVRFAFGTGSGSPKDLLKKVRTLVEVGLPAEVAEAALTREAAELLGLSGLGSVEPGAVATFALWTEDPLTEEKAKVAWSFVDGFPREFEVDAEGSGGPPAEGVDVTGHWTLESEMQGQKSTSQLELVMDEEGGVTGTIVSENPMDGSEMKADVTGTVSGKTLRISLTYEMGDFQVDVTSEGEITGDKIEGKSSTKVPFSDDPMSSKFTATKDPEGGRS